jgi:hypothetical protein
MIRRVVDIMDEREDYSSMNTRLVVHINDACAEGKRESHGSNESVVGRRSALAGKKLVVAWQRDRDAQQRPRRRRKKKKKRRGRSRRRICESSLLHEEKEKPKSYCFSSKQYY